MRHFLSLAVLVIVFVGLVAYYFPVLSSATSVDASATETNSRYQFSEDNYIDRVPEAKAYAVFDVLTGEILLSDHKDEVLPIASVTKLVTAATALEYLDMEEIVTINWSDILTQGRAGKLEYGTTYSYRDLLFPLLLESSNDAAAVFERAQSDTFLGQMNTFVTNLGMADTQFADASGLSPDNVSTVQDLIILAQTLYKDNSYVLDITRLPQYIGPHTGWINNNPVQSEVDYQGGKHGYTQAANRTIFALFSENFTSGQRVLGYIILGSQDSKLAVANLRQLVANTIDFK